MFMTGCLSLVCLAFNMVAFKETVTQKIEKKKKKISPVLLVIHRNC